MLALRFDQYIAAAIVQKLKIDKLMRPLVALRFVILFCILHHHSFAFVFETVNFYFDWEKEFLVTLGMWQEKKNHWVTK